MAVVSSLPRPKTNTQRHTHSPLDLDCLYEESTQHLSFWAWLISVSALVSSSIHFPTNVTTSFFVVAGKKKFYCAYTLMLLFFSEGSTWGQVFTVSPKAYTSVLSTLESYHHPDGSWLTNINGLFYMPNRSHWISFSQGPMGVACGAPCWPAILL